MSELFSERPNIWGLVKRTLEGISEGGVQVRLEEEMDRAVVSFDGEPVMILIRRRYPMGISIRATADHNAIGIISATLAQIVRPLVFDSYFEYDDHGSILTGADALVWASRNYAKVLTQRYPEMYDLSDDDRLRVGEYDQIPPRYRRS